MSARSLRLLPPALGLALALASPAARGQEAVPGQATAGAAQAAPAQAPENAPAPKAKLAAWRAAARPPADVPATAIVRAAERGEAKGAAPAGRRKAAPRAGKSPDPVEIIWHAPGS